MNAFFIDADNLSSSASINEAFQVLHKMAGTFEVRRAYGCAAKLLSMSETLRTHAIRPYPNLFLKKNTTDIALATDLMELACGTTRLDYVAIGSGDMDFAPLVVRLRERGIKVVCVRDEMQTARDADSIYDQVIQLTGSQGLSSDSELEPEPATQAPGKPEPVYQPKVAAILQAVPDLKCGQWQPLHIVAKALRKNGVISKSYSSVKLFRQFPGIFKLKSSGLSLDKVMFCDV